VRYNVGHVARLSFLLLLLFAVSFTFPAAAAQRKRKSKSSAPKKVQPVWPSYQVRREEFLSRVREANSAGIAAPDPLSQFLIGEIIVTGIFETDSGFGAFLHALPNGRTFESRPGSELYNGRLHDIVVGPAGFMDEGTVVFLERPSQSLPERQVSKRLERAPERTSPSEPSAPPPS
jgi:hypothetical protein